MVLLELAEAGLYLLSQGLQEVLPICHQCSFSVVCHDDDAILLPETLTHRTGGVVAIADDDLCRVVDELLKMLGIVLIGWRKAKSCQLPFEIDGRVQLKAIPPTLVVLTKLSYTFGYLMPVSPHRFTYG